MNLGEFEYRRFLERWVEVRQSVAAPKLLVVLDSWERGVAVWQAQATSSVDPPASSERLRHELLALAARGDLGPVLYAGSENRQAQFDEITAAIAAMR